MNENLKPILNQLKASFSNREQIRKTILENFQLTKNVVETTAKSVFEQAKDSKMVHQYVNPILTSDRADQAFKLLHEKLGKNSLLQKIEKYRHSLSEDSTEVSADAPSMAASSDQVDVASSTSAEPLPKKARSSTKTARDAKSRRSKSAPDLEKN